ncbi:MAG: glycosyltransferase family 61 protein [Alphaproteobacteria bacterium]|nr:glycosyltransferase family 61 protein [Alphaproteobacteria bacterium]MBU1514509.1 glycosyltransferase family 61 protein [Alphaproteobacteria bacterium]MBU2096859.1 glycosyltransferase family 61 protein [Alphaproteobacteria bacterium]MBU2153486.1 glycosyltransferase family 61 protein [Alphaproteobacteria bacterium]MBU2306009.1 glycosyltransferase family 61 protein [Alphaproteobacteria bacterium]
MIVTELRNEPAYLLNPAVLLAGAAMVFSAELDQAYIASPFDPQVEYCPEEIIRTLVRTQAGDRIGFEFAQTPDIVGHLSRDVIPLNLLHPNNYFHFLIECLPSLLFLVQNSLVGPNAMIASGRLHPNMWNALLAVTDHLSIPIVQLRSLQAVSCDRVILPTPTWHATELLNGEVSDSTYRAENIQLVRDAFKPLWSDAGDTKLKLYIRRTSGQRLLTNTDEIERMAVAAGYLAINAGALAIEEQIRLFSAASHIIGPTGAWLANLIFTRDDTRVTVLYPVTCQSGTAIWARLGAICGVQIEDVFGPTTLYRERQPIHSDFMIPTDEIAARLAI